MVVFGPPPIFGRYYAAELGRFCIRDLIGYVDGPNQYLAYFVHQGGVDPTEQSSFSVHFVQYPVLPPSGSSRHPRKCEIALFDLDADIGERHDLSEQFPDRVAKLKSLLDAHAQDLQEHRRPAAFVENPKPLLTSVENVPTLVEYLGRTGIEVTEAVRPAKKKQ